MQDPLISFFLVCGKGDNRTMQGPTIKLCNCVGITHYKRGEIAKAIASFTNALKQTRREIDLKFGENTQDEEIASNYSALQNSSEVSASSRDEHDLLLQRQDDKDVDRPWCPKAFITDQGHVELDDVFVFTQPFTLSFLVQTNKKIDSAVRIMFNIALAYHRLGFEDGNTVALHKAVKMYSLAYNILTADYNSFPVMLPAIISNLVHVNRLLGNHDNASRCLQHLLMTLICFNMRSHQELEEDLREDFFSNVIPLILIDRCLAPAA